MLFEIRNLTKVYGRRTVLDIKELDFERGLIYALLGPNGSGKTTLLEILSLLNPPTTGTIRYNHRTVDSSENNLTTFRREIVMVQQNPVLFTTTVYKNLEFLRDWLVANGMKSGTRPNLLANHYLEGLHVATQPSVPARISLQCLTTPMAQPTVFIPQQ